MKEILSGIAVLLTFIAYIPYYKDILRGKTSPHFYSWSLWGLLTIILVALQIRGGAGSATWITAAAGLLCIGVAILSLKRGKKDITRSDKIVALLSLLAMFFWLINRDASTLSSDGYHCRWPCISSYRPEILERSVQ